MDEWCPGCGEFGHTGYLPLPISRRGVGCPNEPEPGTPKNPEEPPFSGTSPEGGVTVPGTRRSAASRGAAGADDLEATEGLADGHQWGHSSRDPRPVGPQKGELWEAWEKQHHPESLTDIAVMVLNYLAADMAGALQQLWGEP